MSSAAASIRRIPHRIFPISRLLGIVHQQQQQPKRYQRAVSLIFGSSRGAAGFSTDQRIRNDPRKRNTEEVRETFKGKNSRADLQKAKKSRGEFERDDSKGRVIGGQNLLDQFRVVVSCRAGLESVLSKELDALSIRYQIHPEGIVLQGPSKDDLLACSLYLGSATDISIHMKSFKARTFAELERKISQLQLSDILIDRAKVAIAVRKSVKSKLIHTGAIKERFQRMLESKVSVVSGADNTVSSTQVKMVVEVYADEFFVSITSPEPLHKRGYRLETGKAPLREDLAFALLYCAGWKRNDWRDVEYKAFPFPSLLDPFCGSGTILIEAAGILAKLPPGRFRDAPFAGTLLYDPKWWKHTIQRHISDSEAQGVPSVGIEGSDRDAGAIEISKRNARRAGVASMVDFRSCAFSAHPWFEDSAYPSGSILVTHPPFGVRTSVKANLAVPPLLPLYQGLAKIRDSRSEEKRLGVIILCQDSRLLHRAGFSITKAFSSFSGDIKVTAFIDNN